MNRMAPNEEGEFVARCEGLEERFDKEILERLAKEYPQRGQDPIHVDLHFAASQMQLYEELLKVGVKTASGKKAKESEAEADPLVRVLGAHYFTYDRARLTKVMAEPLWLNSHVWAEKERNKARPTLESSGAVSFNQLVMFAYRQIFEERRTLNAWLLRMAESPMEKGRGEIELRIVEDPNREVRKPWSILISEKLARRIVTDDFIEEFKKEVLRHWPPYDKSIGASERFRVAADLYADVQKAWERRALTLPTRKELCSPLDCESELRVNEDPDPTEEYRLALEYRQAEERVCNLLRLPTWSHSQSFLEEIHKDVFKMLQSAIFYMLFYRAQGFYSLTTSFGLGDKRQRLPYGVTVLTRRCLSDREFHSLRQAVDGVGKKQIRHVQELLEKGDPRTRLPEEISEKRFGLQFLKSRAGHSIWEQTIGVSRIPAHALATLIKVVEEAAKSEVEHQFPRTAFVLGQSSYLESVGFVTIEHPDRDKIRSTYLDLVESGGDDLLSEIARMYELDRWETGRGILPYDSVSRLRSTKEQIEGPMHLKQYLMDKWGYPEPSDGFHLLDLDARFVYPRVGINCVRRMETGEIGWFQEGSPPAGGMGYKPYLMLSREIVRFVAGITDGYGNGVLISGGHVRAVYRRREWEFYDREAATETLLKHTGRGEGSREFMGHLLNVAERLSHTLRKGAIFVLTDLDHKGWEKSEARTEYFIPMVRPSSSGAQRIDQTDHMASIAQMDGCCIISRNGEILGYGYKIAVSPGQVFAKEGGDPGAVEEEQEKLRARIANPGTRRWSSSLLSKASGWPVLNVSSDGPVTLFIGGAPQPIYPTPEPESPKKPESKGPGTLNSIGATP